jgi:hypothetical protein
MSREPHLRLVQSHLQGGECSLYVGNKHPFTKQGGERTHSIFPKNCAPSNDVIALSLRFR